MSKVPVRSDGLPVSQSIRIASLALLNALEDIEDGLNDQLTPQSAFSAFEQFYAKLKGEYLKQGDLK